MHALSTSSTLNILFYYFVQLTRIMEYLFYILPFINSNCLFFFFHREIFFISGETSYVIRPKLFAVNKCSSFLIQLGKSHFNFQACLDLSVSKMYEE